MIKVTYYIIRTAWIKGDYPYNYTAIVIHIWSSLNVFKIYSAREMAVMKTIQKQWIQRNDPCLIARLTSSWEGSTLTCVNVLMILFSVIDQHTKVVLCLFFSCPM